MLNHHNKPNTNTTTRYVYFIIILSIQQLHIYIIYSSTASFKMILTLWQISGQRSDRQNQPVPAL